MNVVVMKKNKISAIKHLNDAKCNNVLYCFRYEIFLFKKCFWE